MKPLAYSLDVPKQPEHSFLPDFTAQSLDDIDFAKLKKLGVQHLFFDLDQTLRSPYTRRLHPQVITRLNSVQETHRFKTLCLVSNNQRNLSRYSQPINARVFQPFRKGWRLIRKPNPLFFEHVLSQLDTQPDRTVMVGDRLHADVLGGNRMGMYTVYVKKRGAIDYWFDWLLLTRMREKRRLGGAIAAHRQKRKHK